MPVLSDCSQSPHRALVLTSVYGPGLLGAQGNSTALVGTPEQVVDALLDYHDLGVTTFLIRGFDPLEDAIRYGLASAGALPSLSRTGAEGALS
jgi:alkanesulfonate monooxygenase SsuD/methylene tetrahydromethanopterin reductase-like flavin-dependent oxidoreductase (luciferase family)